MISFFSAEKNFHIQFNDQDLVQLCSRCGTPNEMEAGYCIDCGGQLQTPTTQILEAKKIVRCKKCGRYNTPYDTRCANRLCASVLEIEDENPISVKYVMECPNCGHENPTNVSNCEECGTDLGFVEPRQKDQTQAYIINVTGTDLVPESKTMLKRSVCCVIGKHGFLSEQLQSCDYVSDYHLIVTWAGDHFILVDISANGTYIQGKRLPFKAEVTVSADTVIGLGDPSPSQQKAAYFKLECHVD